jgi:hypothetical protein
MGCPHHIGYQDGFVGLLGADLDSPLVGHHVVVGLEVDLLLVAVVLELVEDVHDVFDGDDHEPWNASHGDETVL